MYSNFIKNIDFKESSDWEHCYNLPNVNYQRVIYDNGYYYAFYDNGVLRSNIGIIWDSVASGVNFDTIYGIATIKGNFIYRNTMVKDGFTFKLDRTYNNKTIIVASNGIFTTYNMIDFEKEQDLNPSINVKGLVSFKDKFYMLVDDGYYISSNGIDWEFVELDSDLTKIDANDYQIYIGGLSGKMFYSLDGENFESYTNASINDVNIIKALPDDRCCVCSGNTILLTDMIDREMFVTTNEAFNNVNQVDINDSNIIYISTNTFFGKVNESDFAVLEKVIDLTTSLGVYSVSKYLFSLTNKNYYDINYNVQFDVDTMIFDGSLSQLKTIIKQIVVVNNNDETSEYIIDDQELDGTGLISCYIKSEDSEDKYRLIPDDYELDINTSEYLLDKPLILNKNERIYFATKVPNISVSVVYVYGENIDV